MDLPEGHDSRLGDPAGADGEYVERGGWKWRLSRVTCA
jgi:hypothetical protein